jgi:hypothetical protein
VVAEKVGQAETTLSAREEDDKLKGVYHESERLE